MGTTATVEDIANAREIAEYWGAEVAKTRDVLIKTARTETWDVLIDCLVIDLAYALKYHRNWSSILADMEAGAGDFCPPNEQ